MEKRKYHIFNKDVYLLGVDKQGKKRYLEAPSWDCDWYWGFGYIESYTNENNPTKSKDICEHTHFDILFLQGQKNAYDMFKDFFKETVLTNDEIWKLCDYMHSFYTLRKAAELFNLGDSHYTSRAYSEIIKNAEMEREINQTMIPEITRLVLELLTPEQ